MSGSQILGLSLKFLELEWVTDSESITERSAEELLNLSGSQILCFSLRAGGGVLNKWLNLSGSQTLGLSLKEEAAK